MSLVKLDLRRTLAQFYRPSPGEVDVVQVPNMKYIMLDGSGAPEDAFFQQAVGAMYNLAYTQKFRIKKLLKKDYNVMALEGLWWTKGGGLDINKRKDWLWTLMIVQPDFVTERMFEDTVEESRRKKNPPGIGDARLSTLEEGLSLQTMHVGPYSEEPESIAKLDSFAKERGYRMVGRHHEIYLGDPRRSAPSKLRTILRHPVVKI